MSRRKWSTLERARNMLFMQHPLYGSFAAQMDWVEDNSIDTMCTDGLTIWYNRAFVESLSVAVAMAAIVHEIKHGLYEHVLQMEVSGYSREQVNVGGDYRINADLTIEGFKIGEDWLYESKYKDPSIWSTIKIIQDLKQQARKQPKQGQGQPGPGQPGQGQGQPGQGQPPPPGTPQHGSGLGKGNDMQAPPGASDPVTRNQVQAQIKARIAAAVRMAQGNVPGTMAELIEVAMAPPKVPWQQVLERFWSVVMDGDWSYTAPDRRFMHIPMVLPTETSIGSGEFVFAIDQSGSTQGDDVKLFLNEMRCAMASANMHVYVLFFDRRIHTVDEYDAQSGYDFALRNVGGGGTSFKPVFKWIEEHSINPDACVVMTDGHGPAPEVPPPYPTLWALTEGGRSPCKWGEALSLGEAA